MTTMFSSVSNRNKRLNGGHMHVPTEHNNHPSSDVLSVIITVRDI